MERSVENAQKIVLDMLKSMTQARLSETTGINQVTLANLKKGKASRISEKVWGRLENAYGSAGIETVPLPEKLKKKAKPATKAKKKTISPQPEPPIVKKINSMIADLEELKKQIEPLVELQKVIKKMK